MKTDRANAIDCQAARTDSTLLSGNQELISQTLLFCAEQSNRCLADPSEPRFQVMKRDVHLRFGDTTPSCGGGPSLKRLRRINFFGESGGLRNLKRLCLDNEKPR